MENTAGICTGRKEKHISIIIGVDHGFGSIKTARTVTPAAIARYDCEPLVGSGSILHYQDAYYRIGGERMRLRKDKTADDLYWVLTLYAIAAEIRARRLDPSQSVILGAGLPLAEMGQTSRQFRDYLQRDGEHVVTLDGQEYHIVIECVELSPQGYAGVLPKISAIQAEPAVHLVDIGAWTVDTVTLVRGISSASSERSIENGVIRCLEYIREQLRQSQRRIFSDAQIEDALWKDQGLPADIRREMKNLCAQWCTEMIRKLDEAGIDTASAPVYFLGGGARLLSEYLPAEVQRSFLQPYYLTDVRSNARGYESVCAVVYPEAG